MKIIVFLNWTWTCFPSNKTYATYQRELLIITFIIFTIIIDEKIFIPLFVYPHTPFLLFVQQSFEHQGVALPSPVQIQASTSPDIITLPRSDPRIH